MADVWKATGIAMMIGGAVLLMDRFTAGQVVFLYMLSWASAWLGVQSGRVGDK